MGFLVVLLAAVPLVAILAFLVLRARRRRRTIATGADDADFELVFPEGPDDRPARGTVTGRRIARR